MRCWLRTCYPVAVAAVALAATAGQAADRDFIEVNSAAETIPAIVHCLQRNKEAVLLAQRVECKDYRKGNVFFTAEIRDGPFEFKTDRDCPTEESEHVNARRLDTDAIQQLAHDKSIGSHGIRVIGAIFCQRLELIGPVLPFSLVLDRAVFTKGIELRNVDIQGDLSFGDSVILNQLRIIRSHIKGTLFADNSFIE
jgi:hypothetical protein